VSNDIPAFPVSEELDRAVCRGGGYGYTGMTLRDYFAAKELASLENKTVCDRPEAYARIADHCYRMANAMLAERDKK
jgi:hypothetical protein